MVDLRAEMPSVVYGLLWVSYFEARAMGLSRWISTWFSWIPIFKVKGADPKNPLASGTCTRPPSFILGPVVAMMVALICCSVMREVSSQAPAGSAGVPSHPAPPAGGMIDRW